MPASGKNRLWSLLWLGLVAWQGWMTLSLFGSVHPWQSLRNDQPILSGRHPLHLYHGYLGAKSLLQRGTLSCYDPAFQAGYPKTPVFDSGSRPAELFLALNGGSYSPFAYKVGLAGCCLAVPLVLLIAATGLGLRRRELFLTTLLGLVLWWSNPCRRLLEEGHLDLLLGGLALLAQSGLLLGFHRKPNWLNGTGIALAGLLGWFAHPLLFTIFLPVWLLYYLSVGAQHRAVWHWVLLMILSVGVLANLFWLSDWFGHLGLRAPPQPSQLVLIHRTPATIWRADLWGGPADRSLALLLMGLATVGAVLFNQRGERVVARLFGLGGLSLVLLALSGILWENLDRLGTPILFVPGLLLAVPLAARALDETWQATVRRSKRTWRAVLLFGGLTVILGLAARHHLLPLLARARGNEPLLIGLDTERQKILEVVNQYTTSEARILWEDRLAAPSGSRWTALLPLLSERSYLGGLDPEGSIDHTVTGLRGGTLAGRLLREWSDSELTDYCRRYNIGWIVCWSQAAIERFDRWQTAQRTTSLGDQDQGCLYTLCRPYSFILKGQGRWLHADSNRIALADLLPDQGVVVLSLHYQTGLSVSPSRVRLEKELDSRDPTPLIRLRVDAPVARLTLTWEE